MYGYIDSNEHNNHSWYVVHTDTKREHIVAQMIAARLDVETFCPRIVFHRKLKRGKIRFVEALFPSYIFVYCHVELLSRRIHSIKGVKDIVRYGRHFPQITSTQIDAIRNHLEQNVIDLTQREAFKFGDEVSIVEGPFLNLKAILQAYDQPNERVRLLLEMFGRSIEIDLDRQHVMSTHSNPRELVQI